MTRKAAIRVPWRLDGRRRLGFWVGASRSLCGLLSQISPPFASRLAERIFRTPPPTNFTAAERRVLERGRPARVAAATGRLATWSWGGGPTVLLVHGWGGHAGRLWRYVKPLTEAGFTVVAFDAPGHGASGGGPTSLPDIAEAILRVAQAHGPLEGLVAHSVGATASALAMRRGLRVRRAVFLAPPADLQSLCLRFARLLRLPDAVREGMEGMFLTRYSARWSQFRIVDWARSLTTSLLVFHDRRDIQVPLADGQAVAAAWRGSVFIATRGLGHHRILQASPVIRRAIAFLAEDLDEARVSQRPAQRKKIRRCQHGARELAS